MTATTTTAPAAAAPVAAATSPTHVTSTQATDYQASTAAAQPADSKTSATDANNTAKQQPAVETTTQTAKPDAAAMKAYLIEKTQDGKTALEGKTDAEVEALYGALKTKEAGDATAFKVPDEYKEKPWASKIKSQDDLYKQIDNLTAAVGKKTVVPNLKEATPEERETFYAQLRGKDASEYAIPDHPSFKTPPETQPALAKLFMDNGVSPVQAEAIVKGYQELGAKQLAAHFDPDGFKTSMSTAFGADWEKTTGAVKNTITAMMSPEDAKQLDAMPNHLLGTVYRTLGNTINAVNETLKKYGATETFAHLKAPNGQVAATDLASARQGLRDQLAALSMRPHTSAEKDALIDQIAKSYEHDPRLNQGA